MLDDQLAGATTPDDFNQQMWDEWDVAVALDPDATLAGDGVAFVVDELEMIARFAAKPTGPSRSITLATTAPARGFRVDIGEDVRVTAIDPPDRPTLTLPAEAFVRLVYGRLDADHTPAVVTGDLDALDQLRQVFTGV